MLKTTYPADYKETLQKEYDQLENELERAMRAKREAEKTIRDIFSAQHHIQVKYTAYLEYLHVNGQL